MACVNVWIKGKKILGKVLGSSVPDFVVLLQDCYGHAYQITNEQNNIAAGLYDIYLKMLIGGDTHPLGSVMIVEGENNLPFTKFLGAWELDLPLRLETDYIKKSRIWEEYYSKNKDVLFRSFI